MIMMIYSKLISIHIYLNKNFDKMVLKSIIEKDLLVFRFNLSVKDNGASNQLESIQTIQLHFIADEIFSN